MEVIENWKGEIEELYKEAKDMVILNGKASVSLIQRKLRIGYFKAATILDLLEERGVVGPINGAKPREVLTNKESDE